MTKTSSLPKIYIDALALVPEKKSGIGVLLEQTLIQLAELPKVKNAYQIYLVVPMGKAKYLQPFLRSNVTTKTIPLPARVLEVFLRLNIFPPMDWLLGSGVYVFPNYRNWSLWSSRSLTYIHDATFKRHPEMVRPKNLRYLERYSARWANRSNTIITLTDHSKEEIEKLLSLPYTKLQVIYCGVDTSVFNRRSVAEVDKIKQKYRIPYENYFLYVGSIEPRKNLVQLIRAYQKLPTKIRQTYGLVLVGGDGWLNDEFNQDLATAQSNGHNILKVAEYVVNEDLPALYSGASLLVHPAVYEGFGITPLEAMACETPVVISDIPPLREVSEDAAYYFDPYDDQSLVNSIEQALQNKTETLAHIKRGLVKAKSLSWRSSAEKLEMLIDTELAEGKQDKPVLRRLRATYLVFDRWIRTRLGERVLTPYIPERATNERALAVTVYRDFLREQPSHVQVVALKVYLGTKHTAGLGVKKVYHLVRAAR
jgi:glycosyltransferase involved in cell wall biosynthesis